MKYFNSILLQMVSTHSKVHYLSQFFILLLAIIFSCLACQKYLQTIYYQSGNWDGMGYYLPLVQAINRGEALYHDWAVGYTPLVS